MAADATNAQAHYRLSVVYRKLKRPEDAKRQLEEYQKYIGHEGQAAKDLPEDLRLQSEGTEPDQEGR